MSIAKFRVNIFLVLIVTLVLSASQSRALVLDDESEARGLVHGVASMVYGLAWPTATYKTYKVKSFHRVRRGYDVTVRLSGTSYFSNDSLWVDLVIEFRDGEPSGTRVINHNAILVEPFETSRALAQALDEIVREWGQQQQNQTRWQTPEEDLVHGGGVCISNKSGELAKLWYRWGRESDWEFVELKSGYSRWFWMEYESQDDWVSPDFELSFDALPGEGVREIRRVLSRYAVAEPVECARARRYTLDTRYGLIGLHADEWQLGWEHPYWPNVIASDTENAWRPSSGYVWFNPKSDTDLTVVPEAGGYVGVKVDDGDGYPTVSLVVPGSPADRAGLRTGARLVRVGGESMRGADSATALEKLKGGKGEVVLVTARNPGQDRDLQVQLRRESPTLWDK